MVVLILVMTIIYISTGVVSIQESWHANYSFLNVMFMVLKLVLKLATRLFQLIQTAIFFLLAEPRPVISNIEEVHHLYILNRCIHSYILVQ